MIALAAGGIIPARAGFTPVSTRMRTLSRIIPARAGFTSSTSRAPSSPADHPRSRGVYGGVHCCSSVGQGSSPLARGLQVCGREAAGRPGIIPARAGFTAETGRGRRRRRDHPRSRGVYTAAGRCRTGPAGSSPLARGLPLGARPGVRPRGIIPARAGFTACRNPPAGGARDHPRSRGVYAAAGSWRTWTGGSSPLARGLPGAMVPHGLVLVDHPRSRGVYGECAFMAHVGGRIIPARAGFTPGSCCPGCRVRDHPRSRGVYATACRCVSGRGGSSPLARGLRRRRRQRPDHCGIIPARAGFTAHAGHQPGPAADHPRSRGVYTFAWAAISSSVGSSPLARGLRGFGSLVGVNSGIIPARAGFTTRPEPPTSTTRDHPRSRGVYATVYGAVTGKSGSSPLARGLPWRRLRGRPDRGIIPARAGFTRHAATRSRRSRDHPRSRGVYWPLSGGAARPCGSSPLARGLLNQGEGFKYRSRIIPARAGFTRRRAGQHGSRRDHPRSRGVYVMYTPRAGWTAGSSPLARGLPRPGPGRRQLVWIIPARAGFTRRAWSRSSRR